VVGELLMVHAGGQDAAAAVSRHDEQPSERILATMSGRQIVPETELAHVTQLLNVVEDKQPPIPAT
jgi:hypothetical protein